MGMVLDACYVNCVIAWKSMLGMVAAAERTDVNVEGRARIL